MSTFAKQINGYVGERIKILRIQRGMTQIELATKLGISYQQVQKYEKAVSQISVGRLLELALKLDIEPAYFFDNAHYMPPHPSMQPSVNIQPTVEFMRNFGKIDAPDVKAAVNNLVRTLGSLRDEAG